MNVTSFYVDLHIHLGSTKTGRPVKITASKSLTLENVLHDSAEIKGLDLIGIIDCHVLEVIEEIESLVKEGILVEQDQGGLLYNQKISFILGSEIEVYDQRSNGPIHVLVYFAYLHSMKDFSNWLTKRVTNCTLSSQRIYEEGIVLQQKVKELHGLFIPAHVFTPFKSLYGKGVNKSLKEVFDPDLVDAIELGLSSDSTMASQIEELDGYTFITNSDAHSLGNIAREYQKIKMVQPSFRELERALKKENGREVESNFGLDPRLGKYYQTTCERCFQSISNENLQQCPNCDHTHFIKGVSSRIKELAQNKSGTARRSQQRPPYIHQVPLHFIPGLGPKTLKKLRGKFHTDMNIIHNASKQELNEIVPPKIVDFILRARTGDLSLKHGGGGKYGKVQ